MNEKILNKLISNEKELDKKINFFLSKKLLNYQKPDEFEIKGHLEKARHNLEFVADVSEEKYSDWIVTGCYYAVYHAVLSLILSRGCSSKNHDASLCILIKEYFKKSIDLEEIKLINNLFIDYNDLVFYVHSKKKRQEATYSTKYNFNTSLVKTLIQKTRIFISKVEDILYR